MCTWLIVLEGLRNFLATYCYCSWFAAPQLLKIPNTELQEWNKFGALHSDCSSSCNLYMVVKLAVTFLEMPLPRPENPQECFNCSYFSYSTPTTSLPRTKLLDVANVSVYKWLSARTGILITIFFSFSLRSWLKKNVLNQSLCVCCLLKTKGPTSQSLMKMVVSITALSFQGITDLF